MEKEDTIKFMKIFNNFHKELGEMVKKMESSR